MKNKMRISIFLILSLFLLLQNTVLALTLGSSQKNTHAEVNPGQTAEFTILFWNIQKSSFPVKLGSRQIPEGMSVILEPEEFILKPSIVTSFPAEKGRDYVSTQYGLMLTKPARVSVKVGESVELGEYSVLISATAGESTSGISALLEKTFKLSVIVELPIPVKVVAEWTGGEEIEVEPPEVVKDLINRFTGMITAATANANVVLLFLSIVSILVIAWFIYKRA